MKTIKILFLLFQIIILSGINSDEVKSQTPFSWDSIGKSAPGLNGTVFDILYDEGKVYAGGEFTFAGGDLNGRRISFWDGYKWNSLGTGISNGIVYTICKYGNEIYAGGSFTDAGGNADADYIAKWNGVNWQAVGEGVDGEVRVMKVYGDTLFVGGYFTTAGGVGSRIAKWTGTQWQQVIPNVINNGGVLDFDFAGASNLIYVAGNFFNAGGNPNLNNILYYNGQLNTFVAIGTGLNSYVSGVARVGLSSLYLTGDFTNAGGSANGNYAVKYDVISNNFEYMGSGLQGAGSKIIKTNGSAVYFIGGFSLATGVANTSKIARWDGNNWESVYSNVTDFLPGTVCDIEFIDGVFDSQNFYFGGTFDKSGINKGINKIGKRQNGEFKPLGIGLNDMVYSIATYGNDIYVGGIFNCVNNDVTANYIMKWNNGEWSKLGSGIPTIMSNEEVRALTVSDSILYVGGNFLNAGGDVNADRIAGWNGQSWFSLGSGIDNGSVRAIAVSGNKVFVGGTFTSVAGVPNTSKIAMWDGTNWNSVGGGLNSDVYTIAIQGSNVFVGGFFTNAGGNPDADRIARWDGASWNALGMGLNGAVNTIVVSGANVYIGGGFSNVNGNFFGRNVVRWDGNAFHILGNGLASQVNTLAVSGNVLYAGGQFGSGFPYISRFNGTSWGNMGTGANSTVMTLAISGTEVFAGGEFNRMNGNPSSRFERWFDAYTSAPEAIVIKTIFEGDDFVSFNLSGNITGVRIKIDSGAGNGNVSVLKYDSAPVNVSGIPGNISQYRWIVEQSGFAAIFNGVLRFKISEITGNGINDPNGVTVYSRPTPGTGVFNPLTTSYDAVNGELVVNVTGFSEFAFGSNDSPLPVELTGFIHTVNLNNVNLNWKTLIETNNAGFEIERKSMVDGDESFVKIGFVQGAGNSNQQNEYIFNDRNLNSGRYKYRLKQTDYNGNFEYFEMNGEAIVGLPEKIELSQNYPNPFNPTTKINFQLPEDSRVVLKIFDITGREVATIIDEFKPAGYYVSEFNAINLSSGIYFYRLATLKNVITKKMTLIK
ncbi:MAG TPA: T9SS type A sorting domain-containing protein [Ignavibacteria bacterium]|nr:T9SS type A sorting domain-containing protein [Ignavibacteria bacterium]